MNLYYIQNKGYVGNSLVWWKKDGKGYTCNLNEAWKVPYDTAAEICQARPGEDFMRNVKQIDQIAQRHVDVQDLHRLAAENGIWQGSIPGGAAQQGGSTLKPEASTEKLDGRQAFFCGTPVAHPNLIGQVLAQAPRVGLGAISQATLVIREGRPSNRPLASKIVRET